MGGVAVEGRIGDEGRRGRKMRKKKEGEGGREGHDQRLPEEAVLDLWLFPLSPWSGPL